MDSSSGGADIIAVAAASSDGLQSNSSRVSTVSEIIYKSENRLAVHHGPDLNHLHNHVRPETADAAVMTKTTGSRGGLLSQKRPISANGLTKSTRNSVEEELELTSTTSMDARHRTAAPINTVVSTNSFFGGFKRSNKTMASQGLLGRNGRIASPKGAPVSPVPSLLTVPNDLSPAGLEMAEMASLQSLQNGK
jgi:hypothetical protein